MGIADWDINERPREKLLARGAGSLTDAELLAIFLRTGVRGKSAVDLAREALDQAGGLRALLHSNQDSFCAIHGMGMAKYAELKATIEMAERYCQEPLHQGMVFSHSAFVSQFLRTKLRQYSHEVILGLFLNTRQQLIADEILFHGTISHSTLHPRRVIERTLHHNAAGIILAHNHPSGHPEPSQSDIQQTQRLQTILSPLDINLVDHIIVGDQKTVSLAERGVLIIE